MKIQRETGVGQNIIRAYAPGRVTVNETVYTRSLIVTPEQIHDWPPPVFSALAAGHFESLAALRPEVVIFGSGARLQFPHPALTQSLMQARIGLETMDTAAACRTYNILVGDGRRVLAALLMIEA
jgi:uncharacterized protein